MFDVARGIKALDVSFDVILTSPYARALRTAEILAEVYDRRNFSRPPALAPDAGGKTSLRKSTKFFRCRRIVLVGHEPFPERADFDAADW
jgi:phosphohistidine phosphatase